VGHYLLAVPVPNEACKLSPYLLLKLHASAYLLYSAQGKDLTRLRDKILDRAPHALVVGVVLQPQPDSENDVGWPG
jgi:hypothetical protein